MLTRAKRSRIEGEDNTENMDSTPMETEAPRQTTQNEQNVEAPIAGTRIEGEQSCGIIDLDDTVDSSPISVGDEDPLNQAIHEILPDDDDSDDIICTGVVQRSIPASTSVPIDLTDTTMIDPDEVTVTNSIDPITLINNEISTVQAVLSRNIAVAARMFRNIDVPSTRKRKRRTGVNQPETAQVTTPFEPIIRPSTSTANTNNEVVNLLDSDDEEVTVNNVQIPQLKPLRPLKKKVKTSTNQKPILTQAPPPPSSTPQPSSSSQNQITCPICMDEKDEILAGGKHLMTSPCGHMVCSGCHDNMVKKIPGKQKMMTCVTCRKKVKGTAYIKLFF